MSSVSVPLLNSLCILNEQVSFGSCVKNKDKLYEEISINHTRDCPTIFCLSHSLIRSRNNPCRTYTIEFFITFGFYGLKNDFVKWDGVILALEIIF